MTSELRVLQLLFNLLVAALGALGRCVRVPTIGEREHARAGLAKFQPRHDQLELARMLTSSNVEVDR